jgi:anti-sigma factor RsiW
MKCPEIENHLADYILGELCPELEIQVNEHLAVCEKCRGEARKTESLIDSFRDSVKFVPPQGVYDKIREQIKVREPQRTRNMGMPRRLVFAFGAFLLGVVMTRAVEEIAANAGQSVKIEVRHEKPSRMPSSDTVEFYSVPAKNLASI